MKRIFLGINLSSELKSKIEELKIKHHLAKLPIKLVEPENSHIAIKFLDDLTDEQIVLVSQIIKQNIADFKSFTAQIKDSVVFPDLFHPRVLALKVVSPNLEGLARKLFTSFSELNFIAPEERKYAPHITLGRIKDNLTAVEKEKIAHLKFEQSLRVGAIQLFESKLFVAGPIYNVLEDVKLT